jgi:uncharacterized protein (TIGR03083 family)
MNSFTIDTLSHPFVRTASAGTLTTVPGSSRTVRLLHPPAERAFGAFVSTLLPAKHSDETACAGWTVHELTAHLAAGSAEIADLIELTLAGAPSRATKGFDERERPFRALKPRPLWRRFVVESLRATVAIERLRRAGPEARVWFTGASLDVDALILHAESELVLHRWDIVGSDALSLELLADPRLAAHAVKTVAAMTTNVFATPTGAAGSTDTAAGRTVLRVAGEPDVVIERDGRPSFAGPNAIDGIDGIDADGPHVIECSPAERTLRLWGRHPSTSRPTPSRLVTPRRPHLRLPSQHIHHPLPVIR